MTDIVFEQFDPASQGRGTLRFVGRASIGAIVGTGSLRVVGAASAGATVEGRGTLRFKGLASLDDTIGVGAIRFVGDASVSSILSTAIIGQGTLPGFRGHGVVSMPSRGHGTLRFKGIAARGRYVGVGVLPGFRGYATSRFPMLNGINANQSPGYLFAAWADAIPTAHEFARLSASDLLTIFGGFAIDDTLIGSDTLGAPGTRRMSLADAVQATDMASLIGYIICASTASGTMTLDATRSFLMTMVDILMSTDALTERRAALIAIADLLYATDRATAVSFLVMGDTATATLSLQEFRGLVISLADSMPATDSLHELRGVIMTAGSSATATDTMSQLRAALMGIDDAAFLGGRFVFDGVPYSIYAMQPAGAAMSEYTGLEFNSFFKLGGKMYGLDETGVHIGEGANDNGAPIRGSVYTGLTNFGTTLLKEAPYVYVGLQRSGRLLLKVTSIKKGKRKENWYELTSTARDAVTNARFEVAKGLHANYFGYELTNIDGEDFDVDFVKVWAMELNRRV